jgi:hypothetical protein
MPGEPVEPKMDRHTIGRNPRLTARHRPGQNTVMVSMHSLPVAVARRLPLCIWLRACASGPKVC